MLHSLIEEEEEDGEEHDVFQMFRSITVQLEKIRLLVIPEVMRIFKEKTRFDYPLKKNAEDEVSMSIDHVCALHAKYFFQVWTASLGENMVPFGDVKWEEVGDLEQNFVTSLNRIVEFIDSLEIPQQLYNKTVYYLVEQLLVAAKEVGYRTVEDIKMLNSFNFHWTVCSQFLAERLHKEALDKLSNGIRTLHKEICKESYINESDCISQDKMNEIVKKFLDEEGEEEEEEEGGYE